MYILLKSTLSQTQLVQTVYNLKSSSTNDFLTNYALKLIEETESNKNKINTTCTTVDSLDKIVQPENDGYYMYKVIDNNNRIFVYKKSSFVNKGWVLTSLEHKFEQLFYLDLLKYDSCSQCNDNNKMYKQFEVTNPLISKNDIYLLTKSYLLFRKDLITKYTDLEMFNDFEKWMDYKEIFNDIDNWNNNKFAVGFCFDSDIKLNLTNKQKLFLEEAFLLHCREIIDKHSYLSDYRQKIKEENKDSELGAKQLDELVNLHHKKSSEIIDQLINDFQLKKQIDDEMYNNKTNISDILGLSIYRRVIIAYSNLFDKGAFRRIDRLITKMSNNL
jgi:hypothetical protein